LQTQTISVDMPLFSRFTTPYCCAKGTERLWNICAFIY